MTAHMFYLHQRRPARAECGLCRFRGPTAYENSCAIWMRVSSSSQHGLIPASVLAWRRRSNKGKMLHVSLPLFFFYLYSGAEPLSRQLGPAQFQEVQLKFNDKTSGQKKKQQKHVYPSDCINTEAQLLFKICIHRFLCLALYQLISPEKYNVFPPSVCCLPHKYSVEVFSSNESMVALYASLKGDRNEPKNKERKMKESLRRRYVSIVGQFFFFFHY